MCSALAGIATMALVGWTALRLWAAFTEHSSGASVKLPASWPWLLAFPLILLWWLFAAIRGALRSSIALRRVPEHDGACCWRCLGAMVPMSVSSSRVACARCDVRVGREQARTYWEQTHLSPLWATHWKSRHGGGRRSAWRRAMIGLAHRTRRRPRLRHAVILLAGMVPTLLIAALIAVSIGRGMAMLLFAIVLLFAAFGLISGPGRKLPSARAGGIERRCARCGYDVALLGDRPERCPECGEAFHVVGSIRLVTRMERAMPRGRMVLVTVVLAVLLPALMFVVMARPAWIMRPLPTGVLVGLVGESMLGDGATAELLRRPLSTEQQRAVIERALEVRARDEMSAYRAREALDPFVLAGTMPADLLDRYLLEAAAFAIVAQDAGDGRDGAARHRLELEVEDRSGSGIAPGIGVLFGGWTIDGVPAEGPEGVPSSVVHALLLVDRSRAGAASSQFAPPITVPRRADAEHALVEARIWLILTPGAVAVPIVRWNPDGTPVLPPGVLLAHQVVVQDEVRFESSQEHGSGAGADRSPDA